METLGIIGFVIALVLTPIYLLLLVKGVRSLSDIRDMFKRPPGEPRNGSLEREERKSRNQLD